MTTKNLAGQREHRSITTSIVGGIVLLVALFVIAHAFFATQARTQVASAYTYSVNQNASAAVEYFSNSFFSPTLDSSTNAYVSGLTDKVPLTLHYDYAANRTESLTEQYSVTATVRATYALKGNGEDTSKVWSKEFILRPPEKVTRTTNRITKDTSVSVPYADYKKVANDFRTALALPTNSDVVVAATMHVSGTIDNTPFDDVRVTTVSMPLDEQIYRPTLKFDKSDTKQVVAASTQRSQERSHKLELFAGAVLGLGGFALVIYGLRKRIFKSPYQRELDKIYRYHEGIIVKANRVGDLGGKEVVPVQTFDDMLNLEEELKLPIVSSPDGNDATRFSIIHRDIIYMYTLGRDAPKGSKSIEQIENELEARQTHEAPETAVPKRRSPPRKIQ